MQVYANQYASKLQGQLPPIHLVFGDEPQQKMAAIDALRLAAKQAGFDERQSLVMDAQFEWSQLQDACQSMSLFATRQLIELELPTGKPGTEGSKLLVSIAEHLSEDIILLIHGPKIGKDVQNTKWFKTLDKKSIFVPIYELEGNRLQSWMRDQLHAHGINNSPDIVSLFMDYYEGNLLAAEQEMRKLPLLLSPENMNRQSIEPLLMDSSRFNVFQLSDFVLSGNNKKAIKVLERLENEGAEPTQICWNLAKEWSILQQLDSARSQQMSFDSVFKANRIWATRQSFYNQAIARLSPSAIARIGKEISTLDNALKSSQVSKPFIALCHICLLFTPIALDEISLEYA